MSYDPDNIFARILRDEISSDRVYEDDEFIAFRDIAPQAPVHIVLIPRGEPPVSPTGLTDGDAGWAGRMLVVASRIAASEGLTAGGYRLVMNSGANAGQAVEHLHMHLLGGGLLGPVA
ncbi:MAG: HIT domain-containing protein [Dehalococcoidia bacterium]|jgi:histidine triad (HIT) family protein|nr:HIT domain-containing protein [Dehalococcoidia bacterium]